MELKTYQARSMHDALVRVKNDMGRGAVILHTRTIKRGGLFGIGSKSFVEVTASNDPRLSEMRAAASGRDEKEPPRPRPLPDPAVREAYDMPMTPWQGRSEGTHADTRVETSPPAGNTDRTMVFPSSPDATTTEAHVDSGLRREIDEIRSMVENLLHRAEREQLPKLPEELIEYYSHLIGQDVADELALELVQRLSRRWLHSSTGEGAGEGVGEDALDDSTIPRSLDPLVPSAAAEGRAMQHEWIRDELRQAVSEMLPPAEPLRLAEKDGPMIVAMVGPTGVGKTTTIAKLAATMRLREGKRVGLVTVDSYRIAAVEQLKTYARILDVPLVPVVTPDEMRKAVRQLSDVDLILIDTAGRSPRDEPHIAELAECLAAASPDQVHLVLSTTSREAAIREAIENFSSLGARHLIFTKLDEAVGLGVMLNVLNSADMRLSYLTNGQAVPNDIEEGSAKRVAQLILRSDIAPSPRGKPGNREEVAPRLEAPVGGALGSNGGLVG
ncbi:MAG: flagellar biosynthesis protein FlhF [Planctomycetota bacterium]